MPRKSRSLPHITRRVGQGGLRFEPLERRLLLAADFSDAANSNGIPYSTASHEAVGPMLGVLRDTSAYATNSLATGDPQDEDGVAFGLLRAGQTGSMSVHVTGAPAGARLDAWIDFNRGTDFGPSSQIVDNLAVSEGDNLITFNIPANVAGGHYYARIRLSTAGNLNPYGAAPDGEVEDYVIPIADAGSGPFGGLQPLTFNDAARTIPTDLDSDGDLDLLTTRMTWIENLGGRLGAEIQIATGTAVALAPADVDGDGDMDFFYAGSGVRWYENNGSQIFTARSIASSTPPSQLQVLDFDGDGHLDLLAGYAGQLTWYLNNGSGLSFTPVVVSPTLGVDRALVAIDMDGDADLDYLTALSGNPRAFQWLENRGDAGLLPRPIASVGSNLRDASVVDLDDDGDLDVIAALNGAGGVAWYENVGAFTFTARALDAAPWAAESVSAVDLDADGDLDVAASGGGRVGWYENDGESGFTFRAIASTGAGSTHLAVAHGDFDGDGRLDLVTAGTGSAPVAWYRQLAEYDYGDAPHPYPVSLQDNAARHNAIGPTLGALRDAEADGARSPAGAEVEDDGVVFGEFTPGAVFGSVTVNVQNAPAAARLDAWIDFNGDGAWAGGEEQIVTSVEVVEGDNTFVFAIPTLAKPGATMARFRLSTAGGLGVLGAALDGEVEDHELTLPAREPATGLFVERHAIANERPDFMTTADVDGDGDVDVITRRISWTNLTWHENLGPAGFASRQIADSAMGPEDFLADDLDGDGDIDIIGYSTGAGGHQLVWMENDGEQNFTRRISPFSLQTFTLGAFVASDIADVDGDGDSDVLAANLGNGVYALLNNGQQQFTPRLVGADVSTSVTAADVDRDGDLDVVAGAFGGNSARSTVVWYQNDGALNFTPRHLKTSPNNFSNFATESVAVGDVDGDGDIDIVAGGVSPSSTTAPFPTLTWHEQVAGTQFVQHEISHNGQLRWVELADFDADGDLDIVATGWGTPTVVHENIGSTFVRREISVGRGASVAVADMDGDGDFDLVDGSPLANGFAWYENIDLVDPDYGDAPSTYPTARRDGGPVHNGGGPRLGATRDSETDGAPTPAADGDLDDGVILPAVPFGQYAGRLVVNVQNAPNGAKLDGWIDLNGDGSFNGAGERLFDGRAVVEGDNAFSYNIPVGTPAGSAVARFRISTVGSLNPTGAALDGEVEDYLLTIGPGEAATAEYGAPRALRREADAIHVADIDGDGDADYLTVHAVGDYLVWHENLGDGSFLSHQAGFNVSPSLGARPVDFDRDGDVDIVTSNQGRITWFENDGAERFTRRDTSAGGLRPVFDIADVDGDGDLDVIGSRPGSSLSTISVYLNDGAQGFTTTGAVLVTTPTREPAAIRAADIDRDGDIDFAAAFTGHGAGWFQNQGDGWTYRETTSPSEPFRAGRDVVPVDFDDDGDIDLMVLAFTQPNLVLDLYRNDGAQSFTRETVAWSQSTAEPSWTVRGGDRLQVADLDGDGDFDAAAGTYEGVRIYRNDGPGPLTHFLATTGGLNPYNVPLAVADLDADGALEILASHDRVADTFLLDDLPFGDYDRNGTVDQADRDLYEATLGQTVSPPGAGADGNRNGVVDEADLALWQANQGRGPAPQFVPADFDQNERIDGRDFLRWQRSLGATSQFPGQYREDVDLSGVVDAGDLAIWSRQFGQGVPRALNVEATLSTSAAPSTASNSELAALASLTIVANTVEPASSLGDEPLPQQAAFHAASHVAARDVALATMPAPAPRPSQEALWLSDRALTLRKSPRLHPKLTDYLLENLPSRPE